MQYKRIIPCLDIKDGRVVKGSSFVNLRDAGDPIELAKRYNDEGADELVFLDITASSDKRDILVDLVEKTSRSLFIPFTVGGGITDLKTIQMLLNAGADKVSINTAAIQSPQLIQEASQHYGSQCIVVAIDAKEIKEVKKADSKWEIFTHGGRNATGIDAVKWAVYVTELGAGELLLTSMDQDGQKKGYDLALTSAISKTVSVPVIASGGAGSPQHVVDVLKHCEAALLASLLHFRESNIATLKSACRQAGIATRT